MKILALEYGHDVASLDEAMACYPDSSLIRNNDDFYVPNFSNQIVAYAGIYLQFNKIGKCIEPRFVDRYFKEVGCAVKFMAADVIERNKKNGTATDIACSFDSSLAISNEKILVDKTDLQVSILFNKQQIEFDFNVIKTIPEFVATATKYYTVKIGDLFFVPLTRTPMPVSIGDVFDLSLQQRQLLTCTVK
ncbi:MAG: hypothetical protein MJ198_03945 [Bacteroidales bacterium]|nr:hypothetical protein [Bacteroidales bacterium]